MSRVRESVCLSVNKLKSVLSFTYTFARYHRVNTESTLTFRTICHTVFDVCDAIAKLRLRILKICMRA